MDYRGIEGKSSRRSFLKTVVLATGGIIAAGLGYPLVRYAAAPALEKPTPSWTSLGPVSGFQLNSPEHVNYQMEKKDGWYTVQAASSAWVVRKGENDFDVFDPKCTHLGCPYSWDANTQRFLCPCHGGVFAADGKVLSGPPPRNLIRYVSRVENGNLMISEVPSNA